MKQQPDKITAYYYRAASYTELNLDNQMYRLLTHAKESGITAYALYADSGYSGLNFDRPAFAEMQLAMSQGRIGKIVVTDISRISRNTSDILIFSEEAAQQDIEFETVDGENLRAMLDGSRKFYEALNGVYAAMKGGDCE